MPNFQVIIGVDVETDVGSFTPFYRGVREGVPLLLEIMERRGVKATWFYTGEAARENPETVRMVDEAGHEVGCHSLYHETMGDELFPIPGVKPLLPHEVRPRIELATRWVAEALGRNPRSFRAPRLWGSTAVVNALEQLDYLTDASYPMYFYRERFAPYHPSREDWRQEGDSKILEIPVFADMTMESRDAPLERDRDQWPLFRTEGAECLCQKSMGFVEFCEGKGIPPVLCLYIHPWEFVPMEERYHFGEATVIPDPFITQNCGPYACEQLEKLIGMLQEQGGRFLRCDELALEERSGCHA